MSKESRKVVASDLIFRALLYLDEANAHGGDFDNVRRCLEEARTVLVGRKFAVNDKEMT